MNITTLTEWQALQRECRIVERQTLHDLQADAGRKHGWQLRAPYLRVDFSREFARQRTLDLLLALSKAMNLSGKRERMFDGGTVNVTESRAAWHTALRTPPADRAAADAIKLQRERFLGVSDRLRAETHQGHLRRVIVLGIGGSDLGARLVTAALGRASGPEVRFVYNIDPVALEAALDGAEPSKTAVIVISKSFTTLETLENCKQARAWLQSSPRGLSNLYAVTAVPERAAALGISADNVLTFPEWVGGRFSVWSACGLPVAVSHGADTFRRLLSGASEMDRHFVEAADELNVPLVLGLLAVWNATFLKYPSRAVFPYSQRLQFLVPYLQQLEMESAGKRVTVDEVPVEYLTAPAVWGDVGTTAQHSLFQFLHQGTWTSAVEFVLIESMRVSQDARDRLLLAFGEAQADALAFGDQALPQGMRPASHHAQCPGSRPSVCTYLDDLSPEAIGALLALYEHRIAVASWTWDINAFDQWGVELGKRLLDVRLTNR